MSSRPVLDLRALRAVVASLEDALYVVGDNAWFDYRKMCNITAHTYDHDHTLLIYRDTLTCVSDARVLLARLETRNG